MFHLVIIYIPVININNTATTRTFEVGTTLAKFIVGSWNFVLWYIFYKEYASFITTHIFRKIVSNKMATGRNAFIVVISCGDTLCTHTSLSETYKGVIIISTKIYHTIV
jgi:hypothetical protein